MNIFLGIEFGSTRIKTVAIDQNHNFVCSGDYTWASKYKDGIWTYDLSEALEGIKVALNSISNRNQIKAVGISGMMHGYLAFDKNWNLLVPFRTWQNTMTAEASYELTQTFGFNIPQRWSIAHVYQAILNEEEHVSKIAHITTLAGYIHFLLTGVNAIGVGEASGMFPIDNNQLCYNEKMLQQFEELNASRKLPWKLIDILPQILDAGKCAGTLTMDGANLIDNLLPVGVPFAPPEGDAGTGMVATNSVAPKTGNVSAGTSIFSMIVLEEPLEKVYEEIDIINTPTGKPVAMVHCNNCTNDSNAWFSVLSETINLFGPQPSASELYTTLYQEALKGDVDCGGVLICNYMTGECLTHMDTGIPLVVRKPDSNFTLANFMRATLYSTMATFKLGMDILAQEQVKIDRLTGHGGLFKTPTVGQSFMAAACNSPITCMQLASEGGPYGMALLAAYSINKDENETLEQYLNNRVFCQTSSSIIEPNQSDVDGYDAYIKQYKQLLKVEQTAIETI